MTHPSIHAQTTPEKPAYIMARTGETVTYGELEARSNQAAQLFRSLGLKPGDHIAVLLENNARFYEVLWGAQRSGLYYTAISSHLKPEEVGYIVGDCGAKVFITSGKFADRAGELKSLLKPGTVCYMMAGEAEGFQAWEPAVGAQPTTPIADQVLGYDMLYSSGTTGKPKGVKKAFLNEPFTKINPFLDLLCGKMCGMNSESIYLSPAPLYHAAPLRFNMMVMSYGGTSVIMDKFDAEDYLRLVEQYKATHSQLVPTMFIRMLKLPEDVRTRYDISSLKGAVHAAAPCPVEVKQQMIAWWGPILVEYYAGSEGNGSTVISSKEALERPGSVGRSLVGEVKIVGEDGEVVPTGEIGQIYFAGAPEFSYHNDPEKTKSAYNDKGWSSLGDVGYLDQEGYLFLTDRKAYMIISGGVNIYPQETEDALIGHPKVTDAAVFGVPNDEFGEEVKAVVQLAPGIAPSPALAAELMDYCRGRLSPIKCPKSIDFEAELPRSPTGKLYKRLLRDRYWPSDRGPAQMAAAPAT
ncbi:acyl-CoA synthetase [Chelatococcus reniformis]|uniref:Acyl-CoA synthetase n=1 Tax=Chelatococcus reniformis TaxID=1494448 RepID=A0A916UAV6_9HYPH|nr:acyl-CoA synthetase [Chelatococcus reniformis]GGC66165.1 acyl-CoA synthetase [Chelatococcus reniformis]